MIKKVTKYIQDHDTTGLEMPIMAPVEATKFTCARLIQGLDTISVTGNVRLYAPFLVLVRPLLFSSLVSQLAFESHFAWVRGTCFLFSLV
jgi:monomeric isocitrate dehydrogenase